MKKSNPIISFLIFGITVLAVISIVRNTQTVYTPIVNVSAESPSETAEPLEQAALPESALAEQTIIGEVTVTNVDDQNPNTKLTGSTIQILNKDSGEAYLETIGNDGTLVFELPLGNYSVTQVTPANDYELDRSIYEFTLDLPLELDITDISAVQANVILRNKKMEAPVALTSNTSDTETSLVENAEKVTAAVVPNPVTGESLFSMSLGVVLATTGILFMAILAMTAYVLYLKRRISAK